MLSLFMLVSGTFGVQSLVIIDITGGRVCLKCSFFSFSTQTGCTVELVSSGSIQYTETINRSGNGTAKGCVSDVTEGVYDVRVYNVNSSIFQHEVTDVTVLSQPTTISSPTPCTSFVTIITSHSQSGQNILVIIYCIYVPVSIACSLSGTVGFSSCSAENSGMNSVIIKHVISNAFIYYIFCIVKLNTRLFYWCNFTA